MNPTPDNLALMWSGGKDSALAYWVLTEEQKLRPRTLVTVVTESYGIFSHDVERNLLANQARLMGVELIEVWVPIDSTESHYEEQVIKTFASPRLNHIHYVAAGDLFLTKVRHWRETLLNAAGREALFPLWQRDRKKLALQFIEAGFQSTIVCVDPDSLSPEFLGRLFDTDLLEDLPSDVDPCGENGEFHTFVWAGPIFSRAMPIRVGKTAEREGYVFCELSLDSEPNKE